ncbi:MAG: hypothetical protein ITG02_12570 [Patulibacter sp.]|nr:hypothetical protein [Patulibacter sp.]
MPEPAPDPVDTLPVEDPVSFLAGTWQVDRDLHEAEGDRSGRFVGSAEFVPDGDGLRWTETGDTRLGDYAGSASRVLLVRPTADGWEVRFEDERFFHPLDLRDGRSRVDHPCGEDHYRGELRVESPERFVVAWRVHGPRKDQTIVSRYTR